MNYDETLTYLYNAAPMFQNIGAGAYKEGLTTTRLLDKHFDHPHQKFHTIHVAGTNGKGSCSHTLAALLQLLGFRVGLYTSPHLLDFRERIRINGIPIPESRVTEFVQEERSFFEPLSPSFFELTTALAFLYFAEQKVDFAVIEVGLGGRLDCTNIIIPELSIITNISLDHTQFLGHSLTEIAKEKAGIIKNNVPVIVGQVLPETKPIFEEIAKKKNAPLFFAEESNLILDTTFENNQLCFITEKWGVINFALSGAYQQKNALTILTALQHLPQPIQDRLTSSIVQTAFASVCRLTGLQGRWQIIQDSPLVICDTGHNLDAWQWIIPQLNNLKAKQLHIIFGVCADKDIIEILQQLPQKAQYYWTRPSNNRALPVKTLQELGIAQELSGKTYETVSSAYIAASKNAHINDVIFIGGSSFVVADFLAYKTK